MHIIPYVWMRAIPQNIFLPKHHERKNYMYVKSLENVAMFSFSPKNICMVPSFFSLTYIPTEIGRYTIEIHSPYVISCIDSIQTAISGLDLPLCNTSSQQAPRNTHSNAFEKTRTNIKIHIQNVLETNSSTQCLQNIDIHYLTIHMYNIWLCVYIAIHTNISRKVNVHWLY